MITIKISGVIVPNDWKDVYEWFGYEAVCPKDVSTKLELAKGDAVVVEINSGGGDVFAGSEIYTILKDYKGRKETKITGVAASAASVVAMAGDIVKISPTAQIMIHNVWTVAQGDYRDMQHEAEVLENYNISVANAYMLKTGMKQEELLSLMNKESWLNAQQCKEMGFVDEIMFDEKRQLAASAGRTAMLPQEVVNKIKNEILKKGVCGNNADTLKNKIEILRMKGNLV